MGICLQGRTENNVHDQHHPAFMRKGERTPLETVKQQWPRGGMANNDPLFPEPETVMKTPFNGGPAR
jgi:hypothetical protein